MRGLFVAGPSGGGWRVKVARRRGCAQGVVYGGPGRGGAAGVVAGPKMAAGPGVEPGPAMGRAWAVSRVLSAKAVPGARSIDGGWDPGLSSRAIISLAAPLPARSAAVYPRSADRTDRRLTSCEARRERCVTLHAAGFALPRWSPIGRCALTAPFQPCLILGVEPGAIGGVFSVALSLLIPGDPPGGWVLPTAVSCRARTFLSLAGRTRRASDRVPTPVFGCQGRGGPARVERWMIGLGAAAGGPEHPAAAGGRSQRGRLPCRGS